MVNLLIQLKCHNSSNQFWTAHDIKNKRTKCYPSLPFPAPLILFLSHFSKQDRKSGQQHTYHVCQPKQTFKQPSLKPVREAKSLGFCGIPSGGGGGGSRDEI